MLQYLIEKTKNILITLKVSILTIFITLFIITTATIVILRTIIFEQELTYTAIALMKQISNSVLRELNAAISPIEINAKFTEQLIRSGVLRENTEDLTDYTYYLVKTMPLVQAAYWSSINGNNVGANKEQNGTITTEIFVRDKKPQSHTWIYRDINGKVIRRKTIFYNDFDPRTRVWFKAAVAKDRFIWTDIYPFYEYTINGITGAIPIKNEAGKLTSVFAFDITTDYLNQFITDQKISPNGYSFIINRDGDLIAYPKRQAFTDFLTNYSTAMKRYTRSIDLIKESLDIYNNTGQDELSLTVENRNYLVTYQPVESLAEHGWLIGVITPTSDFIGMLERINVIVLIFCALLLLLGILIVSDLVGRIVKPIKTLVTETEKIKHFDLSGEINIPSRIKEVVDLRNAIRSMKSGLKQFQKYVPKVLVRQLIESGEDLRVGGERKQVVVLFTDIAGFTSIAEKIDPNELISQMSEYFEEMTQIIIRERGTIDKYIGDSIMSFWGAPLPSEKPCEHAARAALDCQKRLEQLNSNWQQQGKYPLFTRIGIHVGDAIVGNLGSSERLNYTALGDTINIASHLEAINKIYKTKIIVSEDVFNEIENKFVFRKIDVVAVKGRTEKICLYELMGEHIDDIPFDVTLYNYNFDLGFEAYQQEEWDKAISYFHKCLLIYPKDTVAPIFVERCERKQDTS